MLSHPSESSNILSFGPEMRFSCQAWHGAMTTRQCQWGDGGMSWKTWVPFGAPPPYEYVTRAGSLGLWLWVPHFQNGNHDTCNTDLLAGFSGIWLMAGLCHCHSEEAGWKAAKGGGSGICLGFQSRLCHSLAICCWKSYLISLCLSILIHNMGIKIIPNELSLRLNEIIRGSSRTLIVISSHSLSVVTINVDYNSSSSSQ